MHLNIPNLQKLGYGNIVPIKGVPAADNPLASYTKIPRSLNWQRYNDWSLGNDGALYH